MRILGYSWVGVYADDFEATIGFFADKVSLPLEWRQEDTDFAGFRLPSGQLLEVFGRAGRTLMSTTTVPTLRPLRSWASKSKTWRQRERN